MKKPILRLLTPLNTLRCDVCRAETSEVGIRVGDAPIDTPIYICRSCLRIMNKMLDHKVYTYNWEKQKI